MQAADLPTTAPAAQATMTIVREAGLRTYRLATTAELRDHKPPGQQITFSETAGRPTVRTSDALFDGLYALAVSEALANSVSEISDASYAKGRPIPIEAFQTGELWKYVWTRDLAYSLHLGLAAFDPERAVASLLFKASVPKPTVQAGAGAQIVQDTGSGGSYPVSTDRVIWALGAAETLKYLSGTERRDFLDRVYPILGGTIEQDRRLVFDPEDGLYRGEQSFLDWREQTYPDWTERNVLTIAMSKALSTNAAHYILLTHAAEYAGFLGQTEAQARYARWAGELREAVNRGFFDPKSGLYSTYLLSDYGADKAVRVARYDLLGESLAILSGLADEQQAASILERYPTGPAGPPVVWPQEPGAPIYHNQAIWPFVTAYWIKAARQAGHAAAADAGMESLERLASLNLSNMENFDFVSGLADVKTGARLGPQVNSHRQLWSVAGYLSMVQDVVFGLETSWEGIRFRPFVTAKQREGIFHGTDLLEWRGLAYLGTRNQVSVYLPPAGSFTQGVCEVEWVELNGKPVGAEFVKPGDLRPGNEWKIFLRAPGPGQVSDAPLRVADVADERSYCSPLQPRWEEDGQGGISVENDLLALRYEHAGPGNIAFTIYRDGQPCAEGIRQTRWVDPDSGDYRDTVHSYRVSAVDLHSGNASHLTPARSFRLPGQTQVVPAAALHNKGGNLVGGQHFEDWGKPEDVLSTPAIQVSRRGTYLVRAEFANGAGPITTGITCAVKRLEITRAASGEVVSAGYLVMPQSGDWKRYDLSSALKADLLPGEDYVLRLGEDGYSRNMSYLQSNARYTAGNGGGAASYNYVNIAALHLLYLAGPR